MQVIINADDSGYDENVNKAIVDVFERGYVTNATLIVNMGGRRCG